MGQALYRKYRSKTLDEIIGQEHITKTLKNAVKTDRVSHAYLFTGPRGVGKTSIARILAHEINALPYTDDVGHVDIIEIDAASNRRIDEIREIREKVFTAPTSAKYKVYIIDEVHMLTKEAFNALLKTLEEPPAHVVFILATTDSHKLPQTIISRTQRYSFRPVPYKKVVAHLKTIAQNEDISISDSALQLLAIHGEGSFRDSISMLDQMSASQGKIEANNVRDLLGLPPEDEIVRLLEQTVAGSDIQELVKILHTLYEQGYQSSILSKQLSSIARESYITQDGSGGAILLGLLERLIEVPASRDPDRALEIVLLKTAFEAQQTNSASKIGAIAEHSDPQKPSKEIHAHIRDEPPELITHIEQDKKPSKLVVPDNTESGDETIWSSVLKELKTKNNTLYGIIRMADASVSEDTITLTFSFNFHKKRIEEAANKQIITDVIQRVSGKNFIIICTVDDTNKPTGPKNQAVPTRPDPQLATISNIFGGGELLES